MRGYLQYDVQKKKKREVQRMLGLVEQWKLLEGGSYLPAMHCLEEHQYVPYWNVPYWNRSFIYK